MNLSQYQKLSERTQKNESHEKTLSNIMSGIIGELGECFDMIKKHDHQGHSLDKLKLEEEIGDVQFYMAWLMSMYGIDGNSVLKGNVEKLKKRFPDGFSYEASINRKE